MSEVEQEINNNLTAVAKKKRALTEKQIAAFGKSRAIQKEEAAARKREKEELKQIQEEELQIRKALYELDKERTRQKNLKLKAFLARQQERMKQGKSIEVEPEFNSESESDSDCDLADQLDKVQLQPEPVEIEEPVVEVKVVNKRVASLKAQEARPNVKDESNLKVRSAASSSPLRSGRRTVQFAEPTQPRGRQDEVEEEVNIFAE